MSDAWFAFYVGDYIRDTGDLSLNQHGAFVKLLFFYYSTGNPLPSDQRALYRIAGAQDEGERAAVDSVMSRFFVLRDGVYHQDRADRELAKRNVLHERLSDAGKKRWLKPGSSPAISQAASSAIASPQPQPQKETTRNISAPKKPVRESEPVGFLKFWESYPIGRRVDRKDAARAWTKGALEMFTDQILTGLAKWLACEQWQNDQFVPHPATFLNKRRWEAEPPRETVTRADVERQQRNADASAGKFNPNRPVKESTAEEKAELERAQREEELWQRLEKGTLAATAENVTWVESKIERLKGAKLPAKDPRPLWFKTFLDRAGTNGQVSAA